MRSLNVETRRKKNEKALAMKVCVRRVLPKGHGILIFTM